MLRHALERDDAETAITSLETDGTEAQAGRPVLYRAVLAHRGLAARWVALSFEIHAVADRSPAGRHASLSTPVRIPGRGSSTVELRYDWREQALLSVDGIVLDEPALRRGPHTAPGAYLVTVVMTTPDGVSIEHQTVRHRFAG
jgi:hypothetical protein